MPNKTKKSRLSSKIKSQGYNLLMRRVPNDLPQFVVKYKSSDKSIKTEYKYFYTSKALREWESKGVKISGVYTIYPCAYYKPMRVK